MEDSFEERRNASLSYINTMETVVTQAGLKNSLEQCHRAYEEIAKLSGEYFSMLDKTSAAECEKIVEKCTDDFNRITRAAGLGEIWGKPQA